MTNSVPQSRWPHLKHLKAICDKIIEHFNHHWKSYQTVLFSTVLLSMSSSTGPHPLAQIWLDFFEAPGCESLSHSDPLLLPWSAHPPPPPVPIRANENAEPQTRRFPNPHCPGLSRGRQWLDLTVALGLLCMSPEPLWRTYQIKLSHL